jgi:hypothetical protein
MSRSGKLTAAHKHTSPHNTPYPPHPSCLGQVTASHLGEGYINWHSWSPATSLSESTSRSTWPTTRPWFRRCRSRSQSTGSSLSSRCCPLSTSISRCSSTSRYISCLNTSSWGHLLLLRLRTSPHLPSRKQRCLGNRCRRRRCPRPSSLFRTPPLRALQ